MTLISLNKKQYLPFLLLNIVYIYFSLYNHESKKAVLQTGSLPASFPYNLFWLEKNHLGYRMTY